MISISVQLFLALLIISLSESNCFQSLNILPPVSSINSYGDVTRKTVTTLQRTTLHKLFATVETLSMASAIDDDDDDDDDKHHLWIDYESKMLHVLEDSRVMNKEKREDVQVVIDYLFTKPSTLELLPSNRQEMKNRKEQFVQAYNINKKSYDFLTRCLDYLGSLCAKHGDSKPLYFAWQKAMAAGLVLRENCVSAYMYVLGMDEELNETLDQVVAFHMAFFNPNEKTVTLRIKTLIAQNDLQAAEDLLLSLPDKGKTSQWKRLRTFTPIIEYYCNAKDMINTLRFFRLMRQSPGVFLDSETYAMIIGSLAKSGAFHTSIDNAAFDEIGFSSGPKLMDDIMHEMTEDIMEIDESSAEFLIYCLQECDSDLYQFGRTTINNSNGICPTTGAKLRLFALDDQQRQHVHDTLHDMAEAEFEEYHTKVIKKEHTEEPGFARGNLARFSEWLEKREGEPFTAIVDGPNVAYYGNPLLCYNQVQAVVDKLEEMGERPLVTMPSKYVKQKFYSREGWGKELSKEEMNIMTNLIESRKLYPVPSKCLDDYYWMLASVSNQANARQQVDIHVSVNDENDSKNKNNSDRFPGLRPMVISNDQMRDHKLELLEPREFRRWCSCHVVKYDIRKMQNNTTTDGNTADINDNDKITTSPDGQNNLEVELFPADFFSREIQGNGHNLGDGLVWHIPVTGWEEPDRFYIWVRQH